MGNPHAVIFVDDPDKIELEKTGPLFENHPLFPERINTEFVCVEGKNSLRMRVWERGSGETLACGTGACASASAAVLCGLCERGEEIKVSLRGGDLFIRWSEEGSVFMRGGADFVYDGVISMP